MVQIYYLTSKFVPKTYKRKAMSLEKIHAYCQFKQFKIKFMYNITINIKVL